MMKIIENLSAKERVKEWKTQERDKNLRDIIYHLHAWHLLMLSWLNVLTEGGKPIIPKEGYTWDTLDELNEDIWNEAQKHPLMDTLELFEKTHKQSMKEIKKLSDNQMFTPFFQTLNHPIIGLLDGCMNEHYIWALSKLNEHYKI